MTDELQFDKKLGFGFFRLPMDGGEIDYDECKKMVDVYIKSGFSYFDVAKPYMNENAERIFKRLVSDRYDRNSYILANKLSHGYFYSEKDVCDVFEKQLEDCGVEYFDVYLMHCQIRTNYDDFQKYHAYEIAQEYKEKGKIKYVGFSFHDSADFLERILNDHPEIDVVQLQVNYYDYEDGMVQSRQCLEVCEKYNKPVIVMEPVKGGTLVNLPNDADALLRQLDNEKSNASYAIRFAAGCKGVKMVLSGMSNLLQMNDNISYMNIFEPLNEKELNTLKKVREILHSEGHIQCTNCKYCVKGCPRNIRIPDLLASLNAKLDFKYNFQID